MDTRWTAEFPVYPKDIRTGSIEFIDYISPITLAPFTFTTVAVVDIDGIVLETAVIANPRTNGDTWRGGDEPDVLRVLTNPGLSNPVTTHGHVALGNPTSTFCHGIT